MGAYLLRRVLAGVAVLFVASFLVYLLVSVSGNPLAQLQANPHISPATIAAARAELHLNEPLLQRYWTWLSGVAHGNFGTATTGQLVGPQLWPRIEVTLKMVIPATILSILIAVLIGVLGAVKQYSKVDHLLTGLAYLFFSTPVFVVAILLKDYLAVDVNNGIGHTVLYTIGQNTPGTTGFWNVLTDNVQHTVLPVLTLTVVTYAAWSRYQRAALLDVLNTDYIRLARAKGLTRRRVLYVHGLRNALVPVVTVVSLDFATILGGAVIVEIAFGWQGFGQFLFQALTGPVSPDVNSVQAWLVIAATAVIVFNIVADVAYGLLDPRIRYA
ncbi:MAG TPA: ABC transporter permease [Streptosporangiaceae bacterium]|nr:ABC transporter permease [Streptosporangiaceae bacterium]